MERPKPTLVKLNPIQPNQEILDYHGKVSEDQDGKKLFQPGMERRVCAAYTSAEDDMLKDIVKRVIKIKVKRDGAVKTFQTIYSIPDSSRDISYLKQYDELMEEEEMGTRLSAQDTFGLWCTLSPEPTSCTPEQLLSTMERIAKKKGITIMLYSIEQSGTQANNNIGYHPHAHFFIQLDKTVQQGQRTRMANSVKNVCKSYKTKSDVYLQIKPVSEKNSESKIKYIMGDKTDKTKQAQVDADAIWRKQIGIEPFYTFSSLKSGI